MRDRRGKAPHSRHAVLRFIFLTIYVDPASAFGTIISNPLKIILMELTYPLAKHLLKFSSRIRCKFILLFPSTDSLEFRLYLRLLFLGIIQP